MGSKQWIGAIELGYILDTLLGVSSKVITVSSGSDMPSKAREIAHHFDTQVCIRSHPEERACDVNALRLAQQKAVILSRGNNHETAEHESLAEAKDRCQLWSSLFHLKARNYVRANPA